jgi:hypothetical protein
MVNDNTHSLPFLFNRIFYSFRKLVSDLASLLMTETVLAKKSIMYMGMLFFILAPLLMIMWLSVLGLCFIGLLFLSLSWQLSFVILSAFNLIVLSAVVYFLIKLKNNLLFSATRQQIKKIVLNSAG